MIVKSFNVASFNDCDIIEIPECDERLYLVKGVWDSFGITTTDMPALRQKMKVINEAIDLNEVMQLGLNAEYKNVVDMEDGSGYAFRFIDDNKVYNVEPQVFVSGVQFSCEHFMTLPLEKLKSLAMESGDDLVRQMECQLTGSEKLFAVSNIDQSDTWFPKVYPYEYSIVSCKGGYVETCNFVLVAWIAAVNEHYKNVLKSGIGLHNCAILNALKAYEP